MNRIVHLGLILGLLFAGTHAVNADVRWQVSIGNDSFDRYDRYPARRSYSREIYHAPRRYQRHSVRSERVVYTAPIYVQERIVVVTPGRPESHAAVGADYGQNWSTLHHRIAKARSQVDRHYAENGLSHSDRARLFDDLDTISLEARETAYDRGGQLRREDFIDLNYRLDRKLASIPDAGF